MTTTPKKQLITLEPVIIDLLNQLKDNGCQALVVGGAVRDAILGFVPKDIDIEVYKINPQNLTHFLSNHGDVAVVGQRFGVTIFKPTNSNIKYDFSVPRRENKIGVGHTDFAVTFDENMTIKDAALRRDFTMNSLAYDPITNTIYDYFGGVEDINNKIIKHTSFQFKEDALRILRAMQFQARFDFEIHPDTILEIQDMLITNDFDELSKERVFEEWMKWAEKGIRHDLIFKFLRDTTLIDRYPVLKALKETPQDEIYHPEGDVEIHTMLCLNHMGKVIVNENISGIEKTTLVLSILLHDIGKPATTENKIKRDRMTITSEGHEELGGAMAKTFLTELGFHESIITPISNIVSNHLAGVNISMIPKESGKIKSIKKLSRKLFPATIQQLLYIMDADTNGRGGLEYKLPTGHKELSEISKEIDVTHKQYEYILMGRHLIEAGLKPSREFTEILNKANEAQENGSFSDVDGAKNWLFQYITENLCAECKIPMNDMDHNYGTEDILCCIHCYELAQIN